MVRWPVRLNVQQFNLSSWWPCSHHWVALDELGPQLAWHLSSGMPSVIWVLPQPSWPSIHHHPPPIPLDEVQLSPLFVISVRQLMQGWTALQVTHEAMQRYFHCLVWRCTGPSDAPALTSSQESMSRWLSLSQREPLRWTTSSIPGTSPGTLQQSLGRCRFQCKACTDPLYDQSIHQPHTKAPSWMCRK